MEVYRAPVAELLDLSTAESTRAGSSWRLSDYRPPPAGSPQRALPPETARRIILQCAHANESLRGAAAAALGALYPAHGLVLFTGQA